MPTTHKHHEWMFISIFFFTHFSNFSNSFHVVGVGSLLEKQFLIYKNWTFYQLFHISQVLLQLPKCFLLFITIWDSYPCPINTLYFISPTLLFTLSHTRHYHYVNVSVYCISPFITSVEKVSDRTRRSNSWNISTNKKLDGMCKVLSRRFLYIFFYEWVCERIWEGK